jgi:[ribosomal protein S5]-alanine N-acetyltransferase
METMPYRSEIADTRHDVPTPSIVSTPDALVTSSDWRDGLPILCGARAMLRELRREDAASLCALLTTPEVSRFISPPPTTVEGFERFIEWAQEQRAVGQFACFAVVPHGMDTAVGLFQIRATEPNFDTAEWGFALGSAFWGTGLFLEGARHMVTFAFSEIGVRRLEARSAVENARGNGALRKVGAVKEGTLRRSFERRGEYLDQNLWTIMREDWGHATQVWGPIVH